MDRVKNLVVYEDAAGLTDEMKSLCAEVDLTIYHLNDLIAKGAEEKKAGNIQIQEPDKEDIFMFSYTSGTTGDPKGVKLSHKMLIGAGYAVNSRLKVPVNEDDCYCSYLPASHSFEQAVFSMVLTYGLKCGFFAGNV